MVLWDGMGWYGMVWDGMGWLWDGWGMVWDSMGWGGMGYVVWDGMV